MAMLLLGMGTVPVSKAVSASEGWQSGWPSSQSGVAVRALIIGPTSAPGTYAVTPSGLYHSFDGTAWVSIPGGPAEIAAVAVGESAIIYTYSWPSSGGQSGSPQGLLRSVDGGSHWRDPTQGTAAAQLGPVRTMTTRPGYPETVLAGSGPYPSVGNRIYRSEDGGFTWKEVYAAEPGSETAGGVRLILPALSDLAVFYAVHDTSQGGLVVKSTDAGKTWKPLGGNCAADARAVPTAIAVDDGDAKHVVVGCTLPGDGGVRIYRSVDGGETWSKVGQGIPGGVTAAKSLVFDPSDGQTVFGVFAGSASGVYQSSDGGNSWTLMQGSTTLGFKNAGTLTIDPKARVLYVATDNGVWQHQLAAASTPAEPSSESPKTILLMSVGGSFRDYYASHDGFRVLGRPLGAQVARDGWISQYFEKGRLEDHSSETSDPNWRFMFGLLADDLQAAKLALPVGGEVSTLTYANLNGLADPAKRLAPPAGFTDGVYTYADGTVFVPYNANLAREAGHKVPAIFWRYINRTELFPGGWLHDIGLPITEAVQATVDKGALKGRQITVQIFQRTVLTYDPLNPADWQVERANVGSDYLKTTGR